MTAGEINPISNRGKIQIGTSVMVAYPMGEQTNNPAHKLDGQTFTVESVSICKTRQGNSKKMFSLEGARSAAGAPYWFLEDELIVL